MNVANLIKILQSMPPNAPVVVDFYEAGVNIVSDVALVKIEKNTNTNIGYYGDHTVVEDMTKGHTAVHITGTKA